MNSLEISKLAQEVHKSIEDTLSKIKFNDRMELSHFLYCLGSMIDLQMLLDYGIYSCKERIKNEEGASETLS
jgi:hypothetical protein